MINAEKIKNEINSYVKNWQEKSEIRTSWREPLVAFADTSSPLFEEHQKLLGGKGLMP